MSRKRKTSLKDILKIFTGSKNELESESCNNVDPAPPLDIPYPKTSRSRTDKTTNKVKISGDIINKVLSDYKASSGDESGTDDNTLSNIFTRVLTRARKKKKD